MIDDYTWECVKRGLETTRRAPSNSTIKAAGDTEEVNVFSGIIRCADCGASMALNRKVRKNGTEKRFYRCSRYANNGAKACTMHAFDADLLESVILHDVQRHAEAAVKDESRLFARLLEFSGKARKSESGAWEKELRNAASRITFIENASKKLFEEKMIGNVPDSLFRKMLTDYEHELAQLEDRAYELRQHIEESNNSKADVEQWLKLIKKCATIDRLDRATAFQLIDHVTVHEQCEECGVKTHDIQVKYNFVGCLS